MEVFDLLPPDYQLNENAMSLTRITVESLPIVSLETLGYIYLADVIKMGSKAVAADEVPEISGITREHNTPEGRKLRSIAAPEMQIAQVKISQGSVQGE